MGRVDVMLDINQEYFMNAEKINPHKKLKKKKEKTIKIPDSLFEIAFRKGLIEKTEEGYIFIGDYEDLLAYTV
jgi:hypothetical protein